MKATLFILAGAVFLLVFQTTLAPSLILAAAGISGLEFLEGHTFDLALICLVYLVLHRDFLGSLLWAAIFGIVAGSFGLGWRGATAVGYFSVAVLGSFVKRQILLESRWAVSLLVAGFTLVEGLVHFGVGHIFMRIPDPFTHSWGILATQAALNALVTPPLYSFLFFFDGKVGGRSVREPRSLLVDT